MRPADRTKFRVAELLALSDLRERFGVGVSLLVSMDEDGGEIGTLLDERFNALCCFAKSTEPVTGEIVASAYASDGRLVAVGDNLRIIVEKVAKLLGERGRAL